MLRCGVAALAVENALLRPLLFGAVAVEAIEKDDTQDLCSPDLCDVNQRAAHLDRTVFDW